ncbi:MAG: DUF1501 domain-containing protein [Verrucomicrobiaceae bacterium]|nr:DUF1501 domain-containing protein [Verrucomicrobiaceae bacterium]
MPLLTRRALLSQLAFAATAAAAKETTHTMICVFLRGGADTTNMWVPYADDAYYRQRPTLSIKRPGSASDASIKLTDHYALHPALRPFESLFKEGRLGAVQSVGITDNTTGSHFECQDQMEHGVSATEQTVGGGWLGRFMRARSDRKQSPLSAVAIGKTLPESLRGAPAASVLEHINDIAIKSPAGHEDDIVSALRSLYGADVTLLGERGTETLDLFKRVSALQGKDYTPENGAEYAKNDFASGLAEIARLIKARVGLEVACIDLGNWDTHFFQGTANGSQAERIQTLADGIAALDADLKSHRANYTIMITTEFGRRIYENASLGTDHGRAFTFMALGDRVKGGRVFGPWPMEATDESNPLGPGGIKPETDFRVVFGEVLRGSLGLSNEQAKVVFPGVEMKSLGVMSLTDSGA